jgi:hypothetical protein
MPTDADDAVATMRLIDRCYRLAGPGPRPRAIRAAWRQPFLDRPRTRTVMGIGPWEEI